MGTQLPSLIQVTLYLMMAINVMLPCFGQVTEFSYQGRLNDGNAPANGTYELRFEIYDAPASGGLVGGTQTRSCTVITGGLFTVTLDFGTGTFTGSARWLEIAVRTNGSSHFNILSPRQALSAHPYAVSAANLSGSVDASQVRGTIAIEQLPTGLVTNGSQMVCAESIVADSLAGNGSNITGLAFVRTNEARSIVNTEGISSSNTITASKFVSTIYQPRDAQMLALNYYPGSTNYLQYRAGQLAFAPSVLAGPDNGLVWGSSYLRLGDGVTDYAMLVRAAGSIGIEHPGEFGKIRLGDDHRLDQMVEMSAGTIPGAENDNLEAYGFGHWWQKQRSHIFALRAHNTNNYYCWAGLQSVYPDESTMYWSEMGSGVGAATLRAYWSLPPRLSNNLGGWQMSQATNIIFEGGKWGFNAFNKFFVTNQTGQSNIAILSSAGSVINGVGFTNHTVSMRTNAAPLNATVVRAWIPIVGTNGQTYLVPGYQ